MDNTHGDKYIFLENASYRINTNWHNIHDVYHNESFGSIRNNILNWAFLFL